MAIALHGNLSDFGMGEVFQLIGQQGKTGVLQVRCDSRQVELSFDGGCIVAGSPVSDAPGACLADMLVRCGLVTREKLAGLGRSAPESGELPAHLVESGVVSLEQLREVEDLLTRDTIFDLLRWSEGSFRFVAQQIRHDRPPESLLGAEQVLMDGLRMVDEWATFEAEVPVDDAVFRQRGSLEEYRSSPVARSAARPADAERILLLVDGRSSVRRVLDLARLGTFNGARLLVDLRRAGWIEPVDTPIAVAPPRVPGRTGQLRRVAAAALPLALFAVVVAWILVAPVGRPPEPRADVAGFGIERSALAEARARFAAARLRNAVEAYRFSQGSWPKSLDEIRQWDARLTESASAAYYFAKRDRGPIVLAPER